MEKKFTPGPWEYSQLWIWRSSQIGKPGDEIKQPQIAYVGYGRKGKDDTEMDEEQKANAKLMATAPEMFDMLEKVKDILWFEGAKDLSRKIDALLTKATTIN